ncbi:hypothetical protein SCUCBS95973_007402 [Sporothrix curviconia]|uniref:Uncharacterized protein n=1 Tax=Sporothrix curviconia TaxID=1260050 RepID=A0ABP0CFR2_9PEZI
MPMDSRFIPCGNADAQVQTCCWQGDVCLADKACFGMHDSGFDTYLAGCTDAQWDMGDPAVVRACPVKPEPYENDPWVGLAYCGGDSSSSKPKAEEKNAWIACPQDKAPTTMLSAGPCVCPTVTQQRIVAFTDGPTLSSYASLPMTLGDSISWVPPYTPTSASRATLAGLNPTASASVPSSFPFPATPSPTRSANSHTTRALGLGLGFGGMFLILGITAVGVFLSAKRKAGIRNKTAEESLRQLDEFDDMFGGSGLNGDDPTPGEKSVPPPPLEQQHTVSELETRAARPWSMRSELDGRAVGVPAGGGEALAAGQHGARASIGTLLSSPSTSPPLSGDMHESMTVSSIHGQLTGHTTGQTVSPTWGSGDGRRSQTQGAFFKAAVELEG